MPTLLDLLASNPETRADAAIRAPGRGGLAYPELAAQVEGTGRALRGAGVRADDRVAIVLPNGPAMASAFACIAPWCAAAPLNPAYKADEFDFYLSDLDAAALIVAAGDDTVARDVAARRGTRVIELLPSDTAGAFALDIEPTATASPPEAEAVALVLHTSGTTSRPKMVPLTQANLCASARNIAHTLALGPSDVCLNVMPLFHIHGLMAPVLATLASGGSVYCTPGFDALRFFAWLERTRPGTARCPPCTRRFSRACRGTGNARPARACASSGPPRRRCRRR